MVVLSASEQASGDYAAATATTSFTVAPATPALSFSAIGTQTYGEAPFAVSATSASPGGVSYSVASGPATISGSVVTLTGIGQVTLIATQQATANYTAATATTTFVAGAPSFTISPGSGPGSTIATNPGGTAAFSLTATPASATFPNPPARLHRSRRLRSQPGAARPPSPAPYRWAARALLPASRGAPRHSSRSRSACFSP
jgi:hypothetical protein